MLTSAWSGSRLKNLFFRESVGERGADPGMVLYLLVTRPWKGVRGSFRCGVVDKGLVMKQCMTPLPYSCQMLFLRLTLFIPFLVVFKFGEKERRELIHTIYSRL